MMECSEKLALRLSRDIIAAVGTASHLYPDVPDPARPFSIGGTALYMMK